MTGALVDAGGPAERARPIALDGRALVDVGGADPKLVGRELVVGLRVGNRGVEKLEDVLGYRPRAEIEDSPRLLDRLAADMAHHEAGLARRATHVPGARGDDHGAVGLARGCLLLLGDGLGGAAAGSRLFLGRGLGLSQLLFEVLQPRDELTLVAALLQPADLELLLELVDGERLPALVGRCSLLGAHRILTLSLPAWARNTRVGANSPSLCPTIDSEMNTGTCLRPSWTAIVWPTISGKIVEVRDQVLTICFWPDSFICSMRRSSRSWTNGPFLLERLIACPSSLACGRGR